MAHCLISLIVHPKNVFVVSTRPRFTTRRFELINEFTMFLCFIFCLFFYQKVVLSLSSSLCSNFIGGCSRSARTCAGVCIVFPAAGSPGTMATGCGCFKRHLSFWYLRKPNIFLVDTSNRLTVITFNERFVLWLNLIELKTFFILKSIRIYIDQKLPKKYNNKYFDQNLVGIIFFISLENKQNYIVVFTEYFSMYLQNLLVCTCSKLLFQFRINSLL